MAQIELNDVLARIETKIRARPEFTSAEIVWASVPRLRVEAGPLHLLFEELIDNGLRYNRSEGPRIEVVGEDRGASWAIEVADNGTGLPIEVRRRISPAEGEPGPEAGGVARALRIVQDLGGELDVTASGPSGTTLRISFPSDLVD
ncbi:MAG: ATP-binding protein [Gemmatimonadota bacterium]